MMTKKGFKTIIPILIELRKSLAHCGVPDRFTHQKVVGPSLDVIKAPEAMPSNLMRRAFLLTTPSNWTTNCFCVPTHISSDFCRAYLNDSLFSLFSCILDYNIPIFVPYLFIF